MSAPALPRPRAEKAAGAAARAAAVLPAPALPATTPATPLATVPPPDRTRPVLPVPSKACPGTDITLEQAEELGRKLDALREEVMSDLGARDADYVRGVIRLQRRLEIAGRALLFAGVFPPAWVIGTTALALAKSIENMELGHNVLHGQWDWMRDPAIHSSTWEWDTMSPSWAWKHSHNFVHHTYTNVVGKDRDVGYGVLRMSAEQPWRPANVFNPVINLALSVFFQWGVALHDIEFDKVRTGEKSPAEAWTLLKGIGRKVRRQVLKDYVVFPALAGPFFLPVLLGNMTANLARNVWSHAVIFCGHFPDGAVQFTEEQLEGETKGQWYVRQAMGASNLTGGPVFQLLTGNLCFQIEHHLWPDMPSNRLAEVAPRVQALLEEYGVEYTTGPLWKQYLQVLRTINRLALP